MAIVRQLIRAAALLAAFSATQADEANATGSLRLRGSAAARSMREQPGDVIGWRTMGMVDGGDDFCQVGIPATDLTMADCREGVNPVPVKALSYNVYWWNLYNLRNEGDQGVTSIIWKGITSGGWDKYDVMGFQECEELERVLMMSGLAGEYESFQGEHALGMAWKKDKWEILGKGTEDIGEDAQIQYYGTRGAQWVRLRSYETGRALLFVNTHGPLPLGSGGRCGGRATAYHLLKLIATTAHKDDAILLVGDFNSDVDSPLVSEMSLHLQRVNSGKAIGGIDHIFSSCATVKDARILGSGGSDHDAIDALVQL